MEKECPRCQVFEHLTVSGLCKRCYADSRKKQCPTCNRSSTLMSKGVCIYCQNEKEGCLNCGRPTSLRSGLCFNCQIERGECEMDIEYDIDM